MNSERKLTSVLQSVPVFPLSETVLFPGVVLPLHVLEAPLCQMVTDVLQHHNCMVVSMQQVRATAETTASGLSAVGCVGRIIHTERLKSGGYNILLQGIERVRLIHEQPSDKPYQSFYAQTIPRPDAQALQSAYDEWMRLQSCVCSLGAVAALYDQELVDVLHSTSDPLELTDILCAVLVREPRQQQDLLATPCLKTRLQQLIDCIVEEIAQYGQAAERRSHSTVLN